MSNTFQHGLASADELVLRALDELDLHTTAVLQESRRSTLSRVLETRAATQQALGWSRWTTHVAVSHATQAIEDDLFSTNKALRRAHASLQASLRMGSTGAT